MDFLGFHGIGQWFGKMPPRVRTPKNDLQVIKRKNYQEFLAFLEVRKQNLAGLNSHMLNLSGFQEIWI